MPYSSLAQIKEFVTELIGATSDDPRLTEFQTMASEFVDLYLKAAGASVPLSPVPAVIDRITSLWAAGLYRAARIESGNHPFVDQAVALMEQYIMANYAKEPKRAKISGGRTTGGLKYGETSS